MVGQPGQIWALGFEYPLAGGRARIIYKLNLFEKPTFTSGTRKGQVLTLFGHEGIKALIDSEPVLLSFAAKSRGGVMGAFSAEPKRRHIYRVVGHYAVVGWVLLQLATNLVQALNLPKLAFDTRCRAAGAGFPLALLFAWNQALGFAEKLGPKPATLFKSLTQLARAIS
jgi:hypothetical protein